MRDIHRFATILLEHDNVHNIFIIVIIFFYYLLTRGEICYFDISRFTFASTIFFNQNSYCNVSKRE